MEKSIERESISNYLNFPDSSLYMIGIKYKSANHQKLVFNDLIENERKEQLEASIKTSTSNHNILSYPSGDEEDLGANKKLRQYSAMANQPKPLFIQKNNKF